MIFVDPGMTLSYFWDKVAILWNIDEIYCGFHGIEWDTIGFDLMELLGQRLSMEYEWTIDGIYHVEIMNYCLQLGKSCTNGKLNESWIGWVHNGKTMENHHLENRWREYYISFGRVLKQIPNKNV